MFGYIDCAAHQEKPQLLICENKLEYAGVSIKYADISCE